jgi:hypothetical protein
MQRGSLHTDTRDRGRLDRIIGAVFVETATGAFTQISLLFRDYVMGSAAPHVSAVEHDEARGPFYSTLPVKHTMASKRQKVQRAHGVFLYLAMHVAS